MKFDIVTPSYNQVTYLKETMDSVLSQSGDGVEVDYYVLDGGSNDGSKKLIRSYESKLKYWRSAQDNGQSAAIAEGLVMGQGDIVAWINSDDLYPPGVFRKVADFFTAHPEVNVLYGDCLMIDEASHPVGLGTHIPITWEDLFETPYLINQESTFFRRKLYDKVGGVNPDFWGAMDYDLWLRLFYSGSAFYIPEILGAHRFTPGQKSATSRRYVQDMQQARMNFAECHLIETPSWPFSAKGHKQIQAKWDLYWQPILKWIKEGCHEIEFTGKIVDIWNTYAQNGVLSVKGGTSFGWIGPEALYIVDKDRVGTTIDWLFSSPSPGLSASHLSVEVADSVYQIEVNGSVRHSFGLYPNKRFSVLRMHADRSFIPALENWGPAYFYLSLISSPHPQGKQTLSVQSIPLLPDLNVFSKSGKENNASSMIKNPLSLGKNASVKIRHRSPQKPFKIAFFTSHPANVGSGSERLIYNTAKALIERGHDARVYVMNALLDDEPPFFVHQMPHLPGERFTERVLARFTGWNDLIFPSTILQRFWPWLGTSDVWHFHNLHGHYLSIPLLSLLSWTKRIVVSPVDKYLSTGHCPYPINCDRFLTGCGKCQRLDEPWPGISRDATKTLWKIKKVFIPHSRFNLLYHTHALAAHYEQTFVSRRPARILHYGVDMNCYRQLDRESCLKKFGLPKTSRFMVGLFHSHLLEPRKGIVPIIKKLGDLGRQLPGKVELLIVGNGGHEVRNIVPSELSVTILPYLRHPYELANALNLCDVLLYPTRAENLSLTCLYALACGVPVISYNAGGQKEAIINGQNGFIVDIGDEEGMIQKLIEMIDNPSLCRQLSEQARSVVEKQFDFENYIDDLIDYYRMIIG